MQNFHILTVKHVAETNERAAMVKIISELHRQSIHIPYTNQPGASTPSRDSAIEWLSKNGHTVIGYGEGKDHYYVICAAVNNCFKPLK